MTPPVVQGLPRAETGSRRQNAMSIFFAGSADTFSGS
jgi:hypothetical protein